MSTEAIGTKDQFFVAADKAMTGAPLSPYERRILGSTHPELLAAHATKAAAIAAKAAEDQRRAAAQQQARSSAALPPVAKPRLADGEDIEGWWKRHAGHLAPVWLVDTCYTHLQEFAKILKTKNDARDELIAALETRIAQLEARPTVEYKGVWSEATLYGMGAMVTHQGAVWYAKDASISRRPGAHPECWQLAVKAGRDGKDLR